MPKKTIALLLASFVVGLLCLLGLVLGVYFFTGPFESSTPIGFLFRPGYIFTAQNILLIGLVVCWFVMYHYLKAGLRYTSEQSVRAHYRDIMKYFLVSGKKQPQLTVKGAGKRLLLAFVIGWFLDLWHESLVATPILVCMTLWYIYAMYRYTHRQ